MSYNHYLNGKIIVFLDEENYLKCRLKYLEYLKSVSENMNQMCLYEYIERYISDTTLDWTVENIIEPMSSSYTASSSSENSISTNDGIIYPISNEYINIYQNNYQNNINWTLNNLDYPVAYYGNLPYPATLENNGGIVRDSVEISEEDIYSRFDILDFD